MSKDRVQLKQEKIVGNEVVLENINPKSKTNSIDDPSTGIPLNQTLDRIWNSINNKLSRVVNSVNGRTGVVVLKASDVGLGNVDNVSVSDIKQWVIQKLTEEFGNKRIKLFDSLQQVDDLVAANDLVNQNAAFYAKTGHANDSKSYIGYIYLDQGTSQLAYASKAINTIGFTDDSMLYNESVNGVNMSGGGIGINIWKYEDALKVYHGANKSESGLYIDRTALGGAFHQFEGVYGDGTSIDENALLYYDTTSIPPTAKTVQIFINDVQLNLGLKLRKTGLNINDLILCNFKDYRVDGVAATGMKEELMCRNTSIGKITAVPTDDPGRDFYMNRS